MALEDRDLDELHDKCLNYIFILKSNDYMHVFAYKIRENMG